MRGAGADQPLQGPQTMPDTSPTLAMMTTKISPRLMITCDSWRIGHRSASQEACAINMQAISRTI